MFGQEDAVDGRRRREAQNAPVRIPLDERQVFGFDGAHAFHDGPGVEADE